MGKRSWVREAKIMSKKEDVKMGVISDILDSIFGSGSEGSVHYDTKTTEKDGNIRVREAAYISDHDSKTHSTIWSNTDVNVNTGATSIKEGGHGENYQK